MSDATFYDPDQRDDPLAVEDRAIFKWLKAHELPHFSHAVPGPPFSCFIPVKKQHRFIVGHCVLPPNWMAQTVRFGTLEDARTFLQPLRHNTAAMHIVLGLLNEVDGAFPVCETQDGTLDRLAAAITRGRLWLMPYEKPQQADIGVTSPAVSDAINASFRTEVRTDKISSWEGGQFLRGYLPFRGKPPVVVANSGITIATGFDIGQHTADELKAIKGLSSNGLISILPFATPLTKVAHHHARHVSPFRGLTKLEAIARIAKMGPVPEISKQDADALDAEAMGSAIRETIVVWEANRDDDVPAFSALPPAWQTVMVSRTYNQGPGWVDGTWSSGFFDAASEGRWSDAVTALRRTAVPGWAASRISEEAAYLASDMPAPIKHAPAAAAMPGGVAPMPGAVGPRLR